MTHQIKAAAAKREITPKIGSALCGFIARLKPSEDILDPLHVRAVVIESPENRVAIVQADVLGLASWQVQQVRAYARRALGFRPEEVLVSATHTHSGPGVVFVRGCEMAPLAYQFFLVEQIGAAIAEAARNVAPARLESGSVEFSLGVNRREETGDGVVLGRAPEKAHPETLQVLSIHNGSQRIFLYTHACHSYVLGGESLLISGDFSSLASLELEQEPRTTALFLNGCAGNIAPRSAFQGPEAAKYEALLLADAVVRASAGASGIDAWPLSAESTVTVLPYSPFPDVKTVMSTALAQERVVRPSEREQEAIQWKIQEALRAWSVEMRRTVEGQHPITPVQCELQVLDIGELRLLGISGEPFYEIGESLRGDLPRERFWPLGYTNGYCGYIPTEREFPLGGYEVNDSYKYVGLWQVSPRSEEQVIHSARELMGSPGGFSSALRG